MKKIFLAASLFFLFTSVKAQELSFEETVKYINDKMVDYGDGEPDYIASGQFTAKANGDVKFGPYKFNLFVLNNNKKKEQDNQDEFGMELAHPSLDNGNTLIPGINFFSDGSGIARLSFKPNTPLIEIKRIHKAIIHLRSLCTKEKDPFDN